MGLVMYVPLGCKSRQLAEIILIFFSNGILIEYLKLDMQNAELDKGMYTSLKNARRKFLGEELLYSTYNSSNSDHEILPDSYAAEILMQKNAKDHFSLNKGSNSSNGAQSYLDWVMKIVKKKRVIDDIESKSFQRLDLTRSKHEVSFLQAIIYNFCNCYYYNNTSRRLLESEEFLISLSR